MAYTIGPFDYAPNISASTYGYGETEEERKRREEEEARRRALAEPTPVTQTIKTDPVTGEQEMTIKGRPEDLSANNPYTPTVTQPVSPDQFMPPEQPPIQVASVPGAATDTGAPPGWQRMLQVESGNRDYTATGAPVTSPKGAMFAAQVMPSTAAAPGFGVTPAQSQTPEEYNRVGQDYYQALLKRYNGDENLARAAYNAGPGRVDQAVQLAAAQGGSPLQYLPKETQGYVQKTAAPAAPAPVPAPVSPEAVAQPPAPPAPSPMYGAPMAGGPGLRMPGQQPQAAPTISAIPGAGMTMPGVTTTPTAIDDFYAKQDNVNDMMAYARRDDAPEHLKERAYSRAVDLMRMDVDKRNAQKQFDNMIANGDTLGIANAMKSKSEEGSWLKMLALGFISPQLAGEEAKKLGFGSKWEQTTITLPDGTEKAVEVKRRGDGKILEASDLSGNPLSREEMNLAAGGLGGGKYKPEVSGTAYVKKDADGNVIARGVRTTQVIGNRTVTKIESGGKTYDINQGWEPESISTAGAKAEQGKKISLQYDPIIEAAKKGAGYLGEFNAKHGTNFGIAGTGANGQPIIVDNNNNQIVKPGAGGTVSTSYSGTPAQIEAKEKIGALQSAAVVKHIDDKLVVAAENGNIGSDNVKKQMALFKDPAKSDILFGLYNAAQSNTSDKRWAIVRDILGGKLDAKDTEVSKAIAELNLNSDQASALREYNALNGPLVAATVHQIGGTQISDRDRAAAEKMQVDVGTTPALGAFNIKANQQFGFDLARYKSDWASKQPVTSVGELEREWRKEQARLVEQYGKVADERLKFIKDNSRGAPASIGLVREAYNRYPVPEYDPNANGGAGGWKKLRSLNDILGVGR